MNEIVKIIEESNRIAVLSHIDEDCDAFGSSLAMLEYLKSIGKDTVYFLSKPVEHRLQFIDADYTVYEEGKDYGKFDTVICLDSGDLDRLGKRIELFNKAEKTINIDHHYTNPNYADINRVDGDMSSTGEMVYDLFCEMNIDITKKMAEYLYTAVMGDTGCLKYSCATPKTLITVAELMKKGIDHADLSRKLFDTEKIEAIKLKGHLMNSIKSFYNGELSVVSLDEDLFSEYGTNESEVGDIVNIPRTVEGTQIALSLRKTKEKVKISLRSNGKYNVGEIAVKLGGGGHEMAAGAALYNCTLEEAEAAVIKTIGEVING